MADGAAVRRHYDPAGLVPRIEAALAAAGLGAGRLRPAELAPLDQFHSRGLAATIDLAEAASVRAEDAVLDVGSGLGGPSRHLAATYGCRVEGLDLSPAFVEAAQFLADRTGLAGSVAYRCADALSLPFPDASFDLAWTQHVAMNIADRTGLYREIARVLKPGGRLACFDVVAGSGEPPHFPVPWARGPETSALVTPEEMQRLLEQAGFRIAHWRDPSEIALAWFAERAKAQGAGPPPLGLHIAMGPDFGTMSANLARNLREGRVRLAEVVATR